MYGYERIKNRQNLAMKGQSSRTINTPGALTLKTKMYLKHINHM